MDNKVKILLGSQKNVDSVNTDNYGKIELMVNESKITEFGINDVVNSTEVFDIEREDNQVYRIYGRIEYLSLLNGLKSNYKRLENFFNPQYTGNTKNLKNSFRFYLVAPHSGDTYNKIINTNNYKRSFIVLTNYEDIEIYNAGFTNNVYGEQVYSFSFKLDFNVSTYFDKFGFPLTELFLYVQYIKGTENEQMSYTTWSTSTGLPTKSTLNTKILAKGNDVENSSSTNIMDIIEYIPEEYFQTQVKQQKFYIRTQYYDNSVTKWLEWSYNPFIPLRLRYFDGVVSTAKLPEIIENTTTLEVYPINNPSHNINLTKTKKQSITTTLSNIKDWEIQTSPYYIWNATTGKLKILSGGNYNIRFKTQIYLPNETDKYIGETYFVNAYGNEILNTRRKYLISNIVEGTNFIANFVSGEEILIRIQLIPNPEIRKIEIIPDYALMMESTGKYIWRDILPQGYVEPLTGIGVDYPFFNKRRYLFVPIILDVPPNLSEEDYDKHQNTIKVFNEISYNKNATDINIIPLTKLDNIGKPCQ